MYWAVIMAGGSGTRLWPLSRQKYPKQALKLVGEKTMFQYAVERITPIFPVERILVVTRNEHGPILMSQAPELPIENFILEPEGRGTASAIGLAALLLENRDPGAVMAILTADHFISKTEYFCEILTASEQIAVEGSLVTLGIQPSSISTGFGYIQHGLTLGERNGLEFFDVQRFIEKPDLTTAEQMVLNGNYSWNSGMFVWKLERIFEELELQMPEFYAKLLDLKKTLNTVDYHSKLNRIWPTIKKQSIDYGVMEGARQVVVIPVDIGWTDIGSWGSLLELLPTDSAKNVLVANHIEIDTHNTLVFGEDRLVATLGVDNLIIIDTKDALLVCSRERAQDVKELVEKMNKEQKSIYL
jgi:mannose-1-phosphate guanylyltransferase